MFPQQHSTNWGMISLLKGPCFPRSRRQRATTKPTQYHVWLRYQRRRRQRRLSLTWLRDCDDNQVLLSLTTSNIGPSLLQPQYLVSVGPWLWWHVECLAVNKEELRLIGESSWAAEKHRYNSRVSSPIFSTLSVVLVVLSMPGEMDSTAESCSTLRPVDDR